MKRRAISLVIALALCLSLCPVRVLAADDTDPGPSEVQEFFADKTVANTFEITTSKRIDTYGHTVTVSAQPAVSVKSTGRLYLTSGTIKSASGTGIEVLSGGFLRVDQAGMNVVGTTYGLNISSGSTVRLSGGTFTGGTSAICAADDDYSALLVTGYAFYDESGNPLLPNAGNVYGVKTVTVKACVNHVYGYTANPGVPAHTRTCLYCGTADTEPCTFNFDETGDATACAHCAHTLEITVNPVEEKYDGSPKPSNNVVVTVMLDGNTRLAEGSDYTVERPTRVVVGETVITVTGVTSAAVVTYYGTAYTKTFSVVRATPEIKWTAGETVSVTVPYDGNPVDETDDLPGVEISLSNPDDLAELRPLLYFSYANDGETDFTPGLPTDVGTYQIRANLPETQNYNAAFSDPLTLTISIIHSDSIITEAPEAVKPVYNKTEQKLVTAGKVNPDAVGAEILFATSADGPWSTDIPTGIDAGDYIVYYKVEGTGNYEGVGPTPINSVKIRRKEIAPDVELAYTSHEYTGGALQPAVTVSDKSDGTVLPVTEYTVDYDNNINTGTADVTITDKDKGNYKIIETTVHFTITPADQDALTIINRPNSVVYGDVFTLETSGGSGSGTVTWKIIAAKDGNGTDVDSNNFGTIAVIDENSGQVTVTGVGKVTVQATKSEGDAANHNDATAVWTFTAGKRPVTATVIADDKVYDGSNTANVRASVVQGAAPGDTIKITGLTGTFDNANAGTNKTVNVDTAGAVVIVTRVIGGQETTEPADGKYIVTIPGTTTASITKAEVHFKTLPTPKELTYNRSKQVLVTAGETDITGISLEYSLSKEGTYSTSIPVATEAGRYEVWYRVQESSNYTGIPAAMVVVTIAPKTVDDPVIKLDPASYVYDGSEKRPAVTVTYKENDEDEDILIPASEYTVTYYNNVNAGTASVVVTDRDGGNYTVNAAAPFTIAKADAALTAPQPRSLIYNGSLQNLVTPGAASGGQLVYAVIKKTDGPTQSEPTDDAYSPAIPQGKNAGEYTVYYKVIGDGNHDASDASGSFDVTILKNTVITPTISLSSNKFQYNGSQQIPTVTVRDDNGLLIAEQEYKVTITVKNAAGEAVDTDSVNVDTYTITITESAKSNYVFAADVSGVFHNTATYEIVAADQETISITGTRDQVYYGDTIQLGVTGGTGNGTITWKIEPETDTANTGAVNEISQGGLLTIRKTGSFTVTATRTSSDNYNTATATWVFYANKKPITAILTGVDRDYVLDDVSAEIEASVNPGDLVDDDKIVINKLTGTFDDSNVGTGKKITVTTTALTFDEENSKNWTNYAITWAKTATASILPVEASVKTEPEEIGSSLTYAAGKAQPLVTEGEAAGGTMFYSLDGSAWTMTVPTGTDAGDYRVYYKVQGDSNHTDSAVGYVDVTIARQEVTVTPQIIELVPPSAPYDGTAKRPGVIVRDNDGYVIPESEYTVTYSNTDWTSVIPTEAPQHTVTITDTAGGNYKITGNSQITFTITKAEQAPLTIAGTPDLVHYKDQFTLSAAGGSGTGAVTWKSGDESIAKIDPASGLVEVIKAGTVTITVTKAASANYEEATATWTFTAIPANTQWAALPKPATGLIYNASEQPLLITGAATVNGIGTVEYSLNKESGYLTDFPVGTDARTYTVWYRVTGDDGCTDIAPDFVVVTIAPKELDASAISLSQDSYEYDGSEKKPSVTVKDGTTSVLDPGDYTVTYSNNINAGTATVTVTDNAGGNYTVNGTKTFTISPKTPGNLDIALSQSSYTYDGSEIKPPVTVTYKENDKDIPIPASEYTVTYSGNVNAGTATVTVTDNAGGNYTVNGTASFTITKKSVNNPRIELSSNTFRYNGNQQKPTVALYDDDNLLIPEHEYIVTITGEDGTNSSAAVGTYTVTIITPGTSNYSITTEKDENEIPKNTATYQITAADQDTLVITGTRNLVYYGDTIQLGISGGTGSGTVTWKIEAKTDSTNTNANTGNEITEDGGLLTIKEVGGPYIVTATRKSSNGNYGDISVTWEFSTNPKPITAVLTGKSKTYDGTTTADVEAAVNPGDLVSGDSITIENLTGEFEDANVGTGKKITITSSSPYVTEKYVITFPVAATADITPKPIDAAAVTVTLESDFFGTDGKVEYNGKPQEPKVTGITYDGGKTIEPKEYTVSYSDNTNVGTATITVKNVPGGNYTIDWSNTFEIKKAAPTVNSPAGKANLTYNGAAQELIYKGSSPDGKMVYSLEQNGTYYEDVPTATAAGDYTVYYKVLGDSNHNDSAPASVPVSIGKAEQSPLTVLSTTGIIYYGDSFTLTTIGGSGSGAVTWKSGDDSIAEVDSASGLVEVKKAGTVTITATKDASTNYTAATATWTFTAQPKPVTVTVTVESKTYDGTQNADLNFIWTGLINDDTISPSGVTGRFDDANVGTDKTVRISGGITDERYAVTLPATTTGTILKAQVEWEDGNEPTATSEPISAGSNQQLITVGPTKNGIGAVLYALVGPNDENLNVYHVGVYSGRIEIGDDDETPSVTIPDNFYGEGPPDSWYSANIPTASGITEAGTYRVWYKAADDNSGYGNWTGINPDYVEVTVEAASSASTPNQPQDSTPSQSQGSTPSQSQGSTPNQSQGSTPSQSQGSTPSQSQGSNSGTGTSAAPSTTKPGSTQTIVQDGTASTVLDTAAGDQLVNKAVENQSKTVVIKPEITGDVTKTTVSLPARAVSRLGNETDASLTVSTPAADVTIPNEALGALSQAGGTVSVITERTENTVVLSLTADGADVGNIPGGLTLTVPVEDAGPGTVAVLVYEDGTRETIRWSVADGSAIRIPLDGSATVEIVDNSKTFSDVASDNWAADSVAFVSAHELFNGTSADTFSPSQTMTRGMLAVVLHNLENNPDTDFNGVFTDVEDGAWYAEGVSWAADRGIVTGYGNGSFGAANSITREQLAVMLWRYAGSPAAADSGLTFTDADEVSGWALDAVSWAVENGIINGFGDGILDPGGLATRAQAAKMLKVFMESA